MMIYLLACGLLIGLALGARKFFSTTRVSSIPHIAFFSLGIASGVLMPFFKNGTLTLAIILMLLAFVGMLFCAKYKSYSLAQPLAVGQLIVVLTCMVIILSTTLGSGEMRRLIENEMRYAKAAAVVMGETLAQRYPKANVLVIVNKNYEKNPRQMEIIEGLKTGAKGDLKFVAIDWPKFTEKEIAAMMKNMPDSSMFEQDMMMMEEMFRAEHYDRVIEKHRDCNVILSLVGLPYNVADMRLWEMSEKDRPKVALMFGDVFQLKEAIRAGYMIALTYKPDVKFSEDPCPRDVKKAFDNRYIVLTKENIVDIAKKFPNYFQTLK